ncbi:MAG TPA: glutathione S-transferase family protein [Hyphomicrobiaceae bacterium]|nr:glutathione S-transferase family protein [Hyphomicrobiaceae bacterium]
MKIYGDLGSGNCLKVKYTADHLGLAYQWVDVDILKGETGKAEFLAAFPMGQIPAVEFDDGRRLAQSNAIVRYLAAGSPLVPSDRFLAAKVDELMFWEQYSHEPYLAVCRFHMRYLGRSKEAREPLRVERGERALDFLERRLVGCRWLGGDALSIADIVLLPYTRLAPEGGFDLSQRHNLRAWIARSEAVLKLQPVGVGATAKVATPAPQGGQ